MRLENFFDKQKLTLFEENKDFNKELEIEEFFLDSRKKVKNGLFFCVKGIRNNSHKFIKQAVENGAIAIAYSDELKDLHIDSKVSYIKVPEGNEAISYAIDKFFDSPSKKLTIYTVTGTNGKTSTAYLIAKILSHFEKTSYNGTIGHLKDDHLITQGHMTTPDNLSLNAMMKALVDGHTKSFALEVSSHALNQNRVDNLDVDVAIFTNLTHDHLDYHQTMNAYLEAKLKLFQMLKEDGIAIINGDDTYAQYFIEVVKQKPKTKLFTYGEDEACDYRFFDIRLFAHATKFKLAFEGKEYEIKTNVLGKLNVYNLCAAIAAIHQKSEISLEEMIPKLENLDFKIGRLDYIGLSEQEYSALNEEIKQKLPNIIVDFAHTPDAFEKVFEFAKSIVDTDHKIICVFGSAGERDCEKRPVMGNIAEKYCDVIILTEDDYRIENSNVIADEIKAGIRNLSKVDFIKHRESAIEAAIRSANAGDCVLILGKALDRFMATDVGDIYYEGDDALAEKFLRRKARLQY